MLLIPDSRFRNKPEQDMSRESRRSVSGNAFARHYTLACVCVERSGTLIIMFMETFRIDTADFRGARELNSSNDRCALRLRLISVNALPHPPMFKCAAANSRARHGVARRPHTHECANALARWSMDDAKQGHLAMRMRWQKRQHNGDARSISA